MHLQDKIFIAGGTGMVGRAIIRALKSKGYTRLIASFHHHQPDDVEGVQWEQLDLTDQAQVNAFFARHQPQHVFLAAAKVGGIQANNTYPGQFIHHNLAIQTNTIHAAYAHNVQRLLFLGSSCIYPKQAPQPMREEHLLTGPLEPTNEPYAIAKIAGLKMCEAYNREYGTRFMAVMPTNLYGPYDNFDLETSHVLPALLRKFHMAKKSQAPEVTVWGTGRPRREFLHVDDMADASVFVMNLSDQDVDAHLTNYPLPCFVNVGTGTDCSIQELAETIQEVVGFSGRITFDTSKPDGTPQKLLDVSSLQKLGWTASISLRQGIEATYAWFVDRYEKTMPG